MVCPRNIFRPIGALSKYLYLLFIFLRIPKLFFTFVKESNILFAMDFVPKGRWYTAKKVLFALSGASTLLSTSFVILAAEFLLKFGLSPQNLSKAFAGTDMVSRGDAMGKTNFFSV